MAVVYPFLRSLGTMVWLGLGLGLGYLNPNRNPNPNPNPTPNRNPNANPTPNLGQGLERGGMTDDEGDRLRLA